MAQTRTLTRGYTVVNPNRDKPECKVVKAIVVAILLASVAMMALVTFGGWSELEGLTPLNLMWCLAYLVLAYSRRSSRRAGMSRWRCRSRRQKRRRSPPVVPPAQPSAA